MLGPFTTLRSPVLSLPIDNVDTDQIIPARFLKGVDRAGLAEGLFADWRDDTFRRRRPEAQVLLVGENFGCGSSREHAAWALLDGGFRAVVGPRFADIFRGNALANGLLTVILPTADCSRLHDLANRPDGLGIEIDLESQVLRAPGEGRWPFELDGFARYCLLHGVDRLSFLLDQLDAVERFEAARSAGIDTVAGTAALTEADGP